MAGKLLTEFATLARQTGEERVQQVPPPRLTDRETEVLTLVAKGMNNREIARELFISENTVKNHVRNILEKLHLHSRMEAVMYAVREKLLDIR
jgi:two-component system NarL family response regulator